METAFPDIVFIKSKVFNFSWSGSNREYSLLISKYNADNYYDITVL